MTVLAVDFDGVIHDPTHRDPGKKMGKPVPGAKQALCLFREQGHEIIVHTIRATIPAKSKHVEDWLDYFDIPWDQVTAVKPDADFFIDDKALHFKDWATTLEVLGIIERLRA